MSIDETRAKSLAIWDEMAAGWQRYNDYLWSVSRSVGEWLVARLDPKPGQTILDIAAGPGDTGFVAAKLIGDEGRLITTDFAPQMMDIARERAADLAIENAEFRVMDAEKMDLESDGIDGAICRWGFMLMLDPLAALKETRRVLRPGGALAFSVWAGPEQNSWVTLVGMALTQMGRPPQGDPFGPGGMFSMAEANKVRAMVAEAGFDAAEIEEMVVHWNFDDFDAFWGFQSNVAGAIATLLKELSEDEVVEVRGAIQEAVAPLAQDGRYDFPGVTLNVLAR